MTHNLIRLKDELDDVATVMTSQSTKAILKKLIVELIALIKDIEDYKEHVDQYYGED